MCKHVLILHSKPIDYATPYNITTLLILCTYHNRRWSHNIFCTLCMWLKHFRCIWTFLLYTCLYTVYLSLATYAHMNAKYIQMHTQMRSCTHKCGHAHASTHAHTHTHTHTHTHVQTCIHTHTHTHTHTRTNMHTHTHTHTHTRVHSYVSTHVTHSSARNSSPLATFQSISTYG